MSIPTLTGAPELLETFVNQHNLEQRALGHCRQLMEKLALENVQPAKQMWEAGLKPGLISHSLSVGNSEREGPCIVTRIGVDVLYEDGESWHAGNYCYIVDLFGNFLGEELFLRPDAEAFLQDYQ